MDTMVLIHLDDEVVSRNGIRQMVLDRASLGDNGWDFVTRTIADFISRL